jgi:hypothetical protein
MEVKLSVTASLKYATGTWVSMNPKISPSPDYYCQDSVPVPEMILYPFLVNAIEIVLRL